MYINSSNIIKHTKMCIKFPNSILEYLESKHNTKAQNLNDDQYMKNNNKTKQKNNNTSLLLKLVKACLLLNKRC